METDETSSKLIESSSTSIAPIAATKQKQSSLVVLPEVDLYIHLLVTLFAIDTKKYKQVRSINLKIKIEN